MDQHGLDIGAGQVAWTATGGTMDADGVFHAGPDEGSFLVTATANNVRGTAGVAVAKLGVAPPPVIKPPVKQEPTSL